MQKDKKIAMIIAYYGKFPELFYIWLNSTKSDYIDFFIITDNELPSTKNIKHINWSFNELQERMQRCFSYKIKLERPYKLCDYKPVYGRLLDEYLDEYMWWGYCDCDMVFGNIDKYIKPLLESSCEKIGINGHFTMMRNNNDMKLLYLIDHELKEAYTHKEVYTTRHSCAYDEVGGGNFRYGLSYICDHVGIFQEKISDVVDLDVFEEAYCFELDGKKYENVIFHKSGNSLYISNLRGEQLKEVFYVHFQKKSLQGEQLCKNHEDYWIYPKKISTELCDNYVFNYNKKYKKNMKKKIWKTRIKNGALFWLIRDIIKKQF